nr:hypothetical protein CFP56_62449 [Quercus suber]
MMAPLYDNKGHVRYFLGAQIDVSSLVEEGRGVESFSQLLQREQHEHERRQARQRNMKEVLVELGDMMSEEEVTTICNGRKRSDSNASRTSSMVSVHKQKPPPPVSKHRRILGMDEDDRELWPSPKLGSSGRLPGVYQNYLLVRPYPSLRITFTSPALRIPGLLQTRLLDRIGGSEHVRQGVQEALSTDTGVTAKIIWLVRDRNVSGSDMGGKVTWEGKSGGSTAHLCSVVMARSESGWLSWSRKSKSRALFSTAAWTSLSRAEPGVVAASMVVTATAAQVEITAGAKLQIAPGISQGILSVVSAPRHIASTSIGPRQRLLQFANTRHLTITAVFLSPSPENFTDMSAEDEQSQSGYEDGVGGPGAPNPLSVLEVRTFKLIATWKHY